MLYKKPVGKRRFKSVALRIALNVVAGYCVLILLLASCQKQFIYYPQNASESELRRLAGHVRLQALEGANGIIGWQRGLDAAAGEPEVIFLVFHGNAGHAVHRSYYADVFGEHSQGRWATVILEYPGYGARSGRPGERSFAQAADALIAKVREISNAPLILVGESLGSGVATGVASRHPDAVAGLLLITPFDSLSAVASYHFPYAPVRLFLRERFDNLAALSAFSGPMAILLAENDEVVPARFGKRLYEGYANGPKRLVIQRGSNHNTLDLLASNSFWPEAFEVLGIMHEDK